MFGPALLFLGMLVFFYGAIAFYLEGRFLPGSEINGYDVSLMNRTEAETLLRDDLIRDYVLRIFDIHGEESEIRGEEIGLSAEFSLEELPLEKREDWLLRLLSPEKQELSSRISYSEEALQTLLTERLLTGKNPETAPRNAFVTGFVPGSGYLVAAEQDGDTIDREQLFRAAGEAVSALRSELVLDQEGCYQRAELRQDDPALKAEAEARNHLLTAEISYDFGERQLILNEDTYSSWMQVGEDGTVSIDREPLLAYLRALKANTDTAGSVRSFRTVEGSLVNVKGPYGYSLSVEKEAEQLTEELLAGVSVSREPVYLTRGVDRNNGSDDYGSSYVEVDLTKQKVYLVQDGTVSLSTDCVTGNVSRGHATPPGIFPLTYKTTNAILRGPDYESHVNYWMPFNGGIGLHDATWRGRFGGEIYRYSGSHGCVNLPLSAAKTLYPQLSKGQPVICHY